MKDIKFFLRNFFTEYSSEGDVNRDMDEDVCFSQIFSGPDIMNNNYVIIMYKKNDNVKNNLCPFTKEEIEKHLEEIKKFNYCNDNDVYKFSIKELDSHYIVHIHLNAKKIYHKFVLSWVRYLYEFPFNMFLFDVKRMKRLKMFKDIDTITLFNLVAKTTRPDEHGGRCHSICNFVDSPNQICLATMTRYEREMSKRYRISECSEYCLGDKEYDNGMYPEYERIPEIKDNYILMDYWKSFKEYHKRLGYYKANFKKEEIKN